jgi:hypothetical protein
MDLFFEDKEPQKARDVESLHTVRHTGILGGFYSKKSTGPRFLKKSVEPLPLPFSEVAHLVCSSDYSFIFESTDGRFIQFDTRTFTQALSKIPKKSRCLSPDPHSESIFYLRSNSCFSYTSSESTLLCLISRAVSVRSMLNFKGDQFVILAVTGELFLVSASTGSVTCKFQLAHDIKYLSLSGDRIICASSSHLFMWDPSKNEVSMSVSEEGTAITCLGMSKRHVIAGHLSGSVTLRSRHDLSLITNVPILYVPVDSVVSSQSSDVFLVYSHRKKGAYMFMMGSDKYDGFLIDKRIRIRSACMCRDQFIVSTNNSKALLFALK